MKQFLLKGLYTYPGLKRPPATWRKTTLSSCHREAAGTFLKGSRARQASIVLLATVYESLRARLERIS